jgi:hypothetical protein
MRLVFAFIFAFGFVDTLWAAPVQNSFIFGLPTFVVDDSAARHPIEKRGFVRVPVDYDRPSPHSIHIFYRWIPSFAGAGAPTLVLMNGGPGLASSMMRVLDYDYRQMPPDKLTVLLSAFNVVLVDQRGTPGGSYPLDQRNLHRIHLDKIAQFMNADVLARDHAEVAKTLIARRLMTPSSYYVLAHSFGLQIGQSYVRLSAEGKIDLPPKGMILSSGQLLDPVWTWGGARRNLEFFSRGLLKYSIQQGREPFDRLMIRAKAHFASLGVDPNMINYAYADTITGDYAADYDFVLEVMKLNSKQEIEKFLYENSDVFGLLNPVLSIQSLNGGRMAADLLTAADRLYHLEDWMIDPLKAFAIDDNYLPFKYRKLRMAVARGEIRPLRRPNRAHFHAFMAKTRMLFHWGRTDLIAGAESGRLTVINLLGPQTARRVTVLTSGGHKDIRTPEGLALIRGYFGL